MVGKKKIKPFADPGFTPIKNHIFDYIMPDLAPNAWKVLCVAVRQTLGWEDETTESGRKEEDEISYSQFLTKTGIGSKSTLSSAIKECLEKQYLKRREIGRHPGTNKPIYSYRLNKDYEMEIPSTETVPGASTESVPEESLPSTEDVLESGEASTESVQTKQTLSPNKTFLKERKESDSSPEKPKERTDEETSSADNPSNNLQHSDGDTGLPVGRVETLAGGRPGGRGDSDRAVAAGEAGDNRGIVPDMWDLARDTEAARAESAASPTVPAAAGGAFALGDALITVACARLGRSEPEGDKRKSARAFFEKTLKSEGLLQGDETMLTQAVKDWLDPQGEYAFFLPQYELSVKHKLALRHFGIVLSKAKKAANEAEARRARDQSHAAASQAARFERLAEAEAQDKGPPTLWDRIVDELLVTPGFNVVRFGPHLEAARQVGQEDGTLRVAVPSEEAKAILEDYLLDTIRRAAVGACGGEAAVEFETEEQNDTS